jgi:short-subunit dehydrogenase
MNNTPVLNGKHAVVFGAGGSIGTAVARSLPRREQKFFCLAVPSRRLRQWQRRS